MITVSKAKDLELRLERTEQQLRLFQKVSRFMVRDMTLQEVLQGIVSLVVETLRALEDALLEFAGSVMVISHDRWFLDRIATHILACEGDSQWVFFDGNYQEYEADKKKRLGEEGAKPHRVRFKALK